MTPHAMRRQIDLLKQGLDLVKPKSPVHIVLRGQPPDSASDAVKATHVAELERLEASGIKVILLVPLKGLSQVKKLETQP